MDRKMTERKAFWHAVLTIGLAVLLVAGFLLYLAGPHSENWPAFAVIILVPALIMLPFVYRKYVIWQCFYPGGVLLAALDHLWRAYKKEGDLSNPQ